MNSRFNHAIKLLGRVRVFPGGKPAGTLSSLLTPI